MTAIRRLACALTCAGAVVASASAVSTQTGARTVVIAELFTSEGCSSCPPADDLLRRLIATQPLPGVEIIGLAVHVDYWDDLGWRDPFSSAALSKRQSAYDTAVFRSNGIYTPQLVFDGALEAVGSDANAVRRSLLKAASLPKAAVSVVARQEGEARARVDVHIELPSALPSHRDADIVVAVTEDGLLSHVTRGENGGRTLAHSAVVRSLTTAGRLKADQRAGSATIAVALAPDWKLANLRIVAFVQEQASRHIFGGGSALLGQDQP